MLGLFSYTNEPREGVRNEAPAAKKYRVNQPKK